MAAAVRFSEHPRRVLDEAGPFLASDPVQHNLVLTLLTRCDATGGRGRFWIVDEDDRPCGIVFQWPTSFFATTTPMSRDATITVVDAIVADGVALPGVNADAATAATFAGRWAERTRQAARPTLGQRLYEVDVVTPAPPVPGVARPATSEDETLVVEWFRAFGEEIGEPMGPGAESMTRARVEAGDVMLWHDARPVALAASTPPIAGAARIGPVFTPGADRRRGYARALVTECSARVRDLGHRCLLYTDLENPTSNAIYQAIGYRAVAEITRYEFGGS